MRSLLETCKYVGRIMGPEVRDFFETHIDDVLYCAKALAFNDLDAESDMVEGYFNGLVEQVLSEVTNFYLRQNYLSDEGNLDINVSYNCVYDKDMNVISPVKKLMDYRKEIIKTIVQRMMSTFTKGRELANKIIDRQKDYLRIKGLEGSVEASSKDVVWDPVRTVTRRDYSKNPPVEKFEVEVLRLERKLPHLSLSEGLRLSELYKRTQPVDKV